MRILFQHLKSIGFYRPADCDSAVWPFVQEQFHYTYFVIEEHIKEDSGPKDHPRARLPPALAKWAGSRFL